MGIILILDNNLDTRHVFRYVEPHLDLCVDDDGRNSGVSRSP
jgi:hypothetical protein